MLLKDVKTAIAKKIQIAGGLKLPSDEILEVIIHEAMIEVANRTIPVELTRNAFIKTDETILRYLRDGNMVVIPEIPDLSSDKKHLQMDEDLNYAVINKVCALISKDLNSIRKFEAQTRAIINTQKANAIKIAQ